MAKRGTGAIFAALLALSTPFPEARAFELSPISTHLEAAGPGVRGRIVLRNTRDAELPMQTRVMRRHVAEDGRITLEPADADFLVFPPQALVPAHGAQTIQFQYVGPLLNEGRSYLLYVSEVPIAASGEMVVRLVFEMGAAVYLHPPGAKAELSLEGATPLPGGRIELRVRNSGARHAVLIEGFGVVPGAEAALAAYGDLARTRPENPIVPPHALRRFVIGGAPAQNP
ncbi:molecular chaperone [Neomegalonema sp.]|uniref:molecular chaperone n=1 Tax=Neomegalonema sp. TaxID=2039713 RepID=UPI00261E5734|nr:molecular chaperone [Neomegalonema sp.]MDD2867738.1 molecular chaperone [Neomegalonema sp.]